MENKKQLYWSRGEDENIFFKRVDEEFGGWPHNAKSVVYRHTGEEPRYCYFCLVENVRDEWNTSFFTADDYYWWKISQNKKQEIKKLMFSKLAQQLQNFIYNEADKII